MASGNRPGFAQTFRSGWAPAKRRAGSGGGGPAPKAAAAQGPGAPAGQKPARARRAQGKNGGAPSRSKASPALVKRKDELSHQFAELQWDLGGIAYEMARRDHYRLEVLNAQAAKLQQVDAELGQIERMLKLDEAGAAGTCASCGALQARGAMYCWKCGKEVKLSTPAPPKPKPAKPKQVSKSSGSGAAAPKTKVKPKPKPKSSGTRILRRATRSPGSKGS